MKKIIFLVFFLALMTAGCTAQNNNGGNSIKEGELGPEEAKAMSEKYLNDTYGKAGMELTIGDVEDAGNVYKLTVNVPNGTLESFISKDGKYFFIEGDDLNGGKSDKPKVELFVMSHCPYGTQIEKGIIPVIKQLGDKIDFDLKFCGYAMHGEVEINEQLTQHCIQKEEPEKLLTYLECFLDEGVSSGCLDKAKVNEEKVNACVASTDQEYKVKELLADKTTWNGNYPRFDVDAELATKYGVSGSPSLVINGKKVNAARRDPQGLLSTVCNSFTNPPKECEGTLSETTPSAGFGYEAGTGNAAGSCN